MLFAVSRVAALRLGSSAAASATRVTAAAPWQANIAIRATVRPFATAGRPKSTTATKKKTTPAAAAKKTTKKPAAKKTVKKAVKKAQPKPKPVKKPKKVVDPEKKAIAQRRELKNTALFKEPKTLATSAWNLYVSDELKGAGKIIEGGDAKLKTTAEDFKNLSASQLDSLRSRGEQNKITNAATYRDWVETLTPVDVRKANLARQLLKRKFNYPLGNVKLIKDPRQPKEATASFALFVRAKWAAGDFDKRSGGVAQHASAMAAEWKGLSAAERKPYEDLHAAERERYVKEMRDVLGVELKPRARSV